MEVAEIAGKDEVVGVDEGDVFPMGDVYAGVAGVGKASVLFMYYLYAGVCGGIGVALLAEASVEPSSTRIISRLLKSCDVMLATQRSRYASTL